MLQNSFTIFTPNLILITSESSVLGYVGSITCIIMLIGFLFLKPYLNSSKPRFDFLNEFMVLTAYILKVDGKVTTKEIQYVKAFVKQEFGEKDYEENIKTLNKYLQRDIPIGGVLKKIDYEEAPEIKIHLLHYLIRITILDHYLKTSEYMALANITKGLGLNNGRLIALLSLYNYTTETQHKKQQSRGERKTNARPVKSDLKRAFSILELSENASEKEIKKTYRKLVVLYHPDKIMHLDKHLQKGAKEMFQKVNDAYDLIKNYKGLK